MRGRNRGQTRPSEIVLKKSSCPKRFPLSRLLCGPVAIGALWEFAVGVRFKGGRVYFDDPDGAAYQRWILAGERSGLRTHIAAMGSVSLCRPMYS